jgi:S4 domain protein YaaA
MREIAIYTEFITLGQLLKLADMVGSGGEVKSFLAETSIKVNGEHDNRRGRKIYAGDTVEVEGHGTPLRIVAADT